ncbi:hypothetical protein K3759_11090 [Sulfitobacter sp. W027]|uniref:hypothetical protein n=1 Tax=Sulfitobacter sp. W027 TaxID=2867025 RepID=UPI0021A2AFC7|nr:hypothetical protein [Sulfitobacter sp. W027]UWR32502.1 hypothetical protein K3759_11090 [Sulfitobacter sp. W027]
MTPNAKKFKVGLDEYWSVPAEDLPEMGISVVGNYIFPVEKPDDKLKFPSSSSSENMGFYATSGAIQHFVNRERPYGPPAPIRPSDQSKGFAAIQLALFDDLEVDFECLEVLNAHGWLERNGEIKRDLVADIAKIDGVCSITKAKIQFGENWEVLLLERAAVHFAEPLSRLWYAANIRSLYYAHHDDIRVGYLWAEYRFKMKMELNTLRGEKVLKAAAKAADQTNSAHIGLREARFRVMERFVPTIGPDKAAIECELRGLGSAQAVKRQWNRFQGGGRDTPK